MAGFSPDHSGPGSSEPDRAPHRRPRRALPALVGAWLAYLAADFLTHAVALAGWWRRYEQYWLPPAELFRRIPFGYASFAVYCGALVWLLLRLGSGSAGPRAGLRIGGTVGLLYGTAGALAVYSVFASPPSLVAVWIASATLASAVAGASAGWVLAAERPWRRVSLTLGLALVLVGVGIVVENVTTAGGG